MFLLIPGILGESRRQGRHPQIGDPVAVPIAVHISRCLCGALFRTTTLSEIRAHNGPLSLTASTTAVAADPRRVVVKSLTSLIALLNKINWDWF